MPRLSDADRSRLAAERAELAAYLRKPGPGAFRLERREAYCVDAVLCASPAAWLAMVLRWLLVSMGDLAPACPLKALFYRLAGAKIGRGVCISPGAILDPLFPQLVELEPGACLGMGCRLMTHEYTADCFRIAPVRIRRGAVVGGWATVRCGVTVGERATVGLNSLVNRDVADGDTVGGVPARSLRREGGTGSGFRVPGSEFQVDDQAATPSPVSLNPEPGTMNPEPR
jgi:hypothetical protein